MENGIFFKFEILATNIDLSQISKNICQQLLSLNNVLKLSLINQKTPFLLDQRLTMNDHQKWSAKVLDKFIES